MTVVLECADMSALSVGERDSGFVRVAHFVLLRKPSLNEVGIASRVRACQYDYGPASYAIPNQIRKAANYRPANIAVDNLINERRLEKTIKDARDFRPEFSTEAASLRFVPDLRLGNIHLCRAANLDFKAQGVKRSSRALTSGQGD